MSWNYAEIAQRDQIAELKKQLSVNETKLAALQDQLLLQSQELDSTKDTLVETTDKLRQESDLTVELQAQLRRRNEELQKERLSRENTENALRATHTELKERDASAKESEHFLSEMAHSATVSQAEHTNLLNDKARLEEQVKSLLAETRRLQLAAPITPRLAARPRSSSLTNLKFATLESDLEQVRATASSSQTELDATKAKLAQVRNELLRVENEKSVLEKRMREDSHRLKDAIEEKEDLEREVEYIREQNASDERENELLFRLDEEEKKVALLEKELTKLSQTKELKRNLRNVQIRLEEETAKRLSVEQREAELAKERDMILDHLQEVKGRLHELEQTLSSREIRIQDFERLESKVFESLESGVAPTEKVSSIAPEIEKSVEAMLSAISRLRTERDQLQLDFDYLQMESRFQVESLQSQLAQMQREKQLNAEETDKCRSESTLLRSELDGERLRKGSLQTALLTMSVVVQHLHRETDDIRAEAAKMFASHNEESSRFQARIAELHSCLVMKEEEIANLEEQLGQKIEEVAQLSAPSCSVRRAEVEGLKPLNEGPVEVKEGETSNPEPEAYRLPSEPYHTNEGPETLRRGCDRCRVMSEDVGPIKALQDEVKELERRILRRNEQIGIHQHEIKRLQTNLRLLDERVEELESELTIASTEKEAMLDDCTTTRGERDEAKRALETAEIEIDRLGASTIELDEQINMLQHKLTSFELEREQLDFSHVQELATMVAVVAERDSRVRSLVTSLRAANADIQQARAHANLLSTELDSTRASVCQAEEALRARNEEELKALVNQLDNKRDEVKKLALELELAKTEEGNVSGTLHTHVNELCRAREQVASLESDKNDLMMRLEAFEADASHAREESANLRSRLEEERSEHAVVVKDLEEKVAAAQATKDSEIRELKVTNNNVQMQLNEVNNVLRRVERELADSKALCARLENDQKSDSSDQMREIGELQGQVGSLREELECLNAALQEETEGRREDREAHAIVLKTELNKRELAIGQATELRKEVDEYKAQLAEVQSSLDELKRVKENMQAEIDDLSAECHRSRLQSDCLQKQIDSNMKELSTLQDELGSAQQSLSHSEKDCRAAQMKLVLATQQYEQSISSIQQQLKDREKNDGALCELKQVVANLKEQLAEMDDLLRAKSREIEAEDDKFIELLEEKKKLARKVESLSRKNQNLRKKLESASEPPNPANQCNSIIPVAVPNASQSTNTPPIQITPPTTRTPSSYSNLPTSNHGRLSVVSPSASTGNDQLVVASTPKAREGALVTTSTIGKKRPLPEDSEPRSVPVTAIICEDPRNVSTPPLPSASSSSHLSKLDSSTPRTRRPLQTLRSGFTPNRGQGSSLRPTLSQPSPTRKTAAQALHIAAAITDITSSPAAKRVFSSVPHAPVQKPVSRGWLGKIRGGNALVRSREHHGPEGLL